MPWYNVARHTELAHHGDRKTVFVDEIKILLINLNGKIYAIEDLCTHDGGDLAGGEIDGDEIICPRHGARFCITNGEVRTPPAYEDIQSFPTKIENDAVWVEN
jgi:3-phenylpropionate/trans-cinnamate dioxygenase ferredoxin subunit